MSVILTPSTSSRSRTSDICLRNLFLSTRNCYEGTFGIWVPIKSIKPGVSTNLYLKCVGPRLSQPGLVSESLIVRVDSQSSPWPPTAIVHRSRSRSLGPRSELWRMDEGWVLAVTLKGGWHRDRQVPPCPVPPSPSSPLSHPPPPLAAHSN